MDRVRPAMLIAARVMVDVGRRLPRMLKVDPDAVELGNGRMAVLLYNKPIYLYLCRSQNMWSEPWINTRRRVTISTPVDFASRGRAATSIGVTRGKCLAAAAAAYPTKPADRAESLKSRVAAVQLLGMVRKY